MDFVYDVPTKVYFGDKLEYLGGELKKFGKRVLLTYGAAQSKRAVFTEESSPR